MYYLCRKPKFIKLSRNGNVKHLSEEKLYRKIEYSDNTFCIVCKSEVKIYQKQNTVELTRKQIESLLRLMEEI